VILTILVANATVGVVTERNAENAIEELKAYEADQATVVRNQGQLVVIPSSELVPGDIVQVSVGGKVPADVRIVSIHTSVLDVDQSLLTGESHSVEKQLAPCNATGAVYQDMSCMLFSGTLIVAGRARGVVVSTGSSTAIGKTIASHDHS
jgi:Ca2+ transporting ATPase